MQPTDFFFTILRHYSQLFASFESYYSLFAIRDYSFFAIRVSQTPWREPCCASRTLHVHPRLNFQKVPPPPVFPRLVLGFIKQNAKLMDRFIGISYFLGFLECFAMRSVVHARQVQSYILGLNWRERLDSSSSRDAEIGRQAWLV